MQKKTLLYPNISAEMARSGLTIAMLADFMGMTTQNVYNKFNGKTAITQRDMKSIQEFLRVKGGGTFTLDYLFNTNGV
jgi:hypothetical protein